MKAVEPWIDTYEYPNPLPRWNRAGRFHYVFSFVMVWGFVALHMYLTYFAAISKGLKVAAAAFCVPVISEIYWCIRFWRLFGPFNVVNFGLLAIAIGSLGTVCMPGRFDIITPKFIHYKHWKGHLGEFRKEFEAKEGRVISKEPSEIIYRFDSTESQN